MVELLDLLVLQFGQFDLFGEFLLELIDDLNGASRMFQLLLQFLNFFIKFIDNVVIINNLFVLVENDFNQLVLVHVLYVYSIDAI